MQIRTVSRTNSSYARGNDRRISDKLRFTGYGIFSVAIAGISLNRVTVGILNRTSSAFGGLTIGASGLTTTRNQALDSSAVSTPTKGIVSAAPDTSASRKNLLTKLGGSLTDLRASLEALQGKANNASRTPAAEYTSVMRFRDEDITQTQTAFRQRDVFADRDRFESRTVYEDRDVFETRNTYGTRDVFETRDRYETRDVFRTENIYETRNVYETRAVYEQQAIHETNVAGTRNLSPYASVSAAGIDTGADLAVSVGNGPAATIKFNSASEISVTSQGTTTNFHFNANDGSFRTTLATALSSVHGLSAAIGSDGKLHLTTANAQSLTIADVANKLLDLSKSPLAALGLTAGTTESRVVGYRSVQTGTEQVLVGTEQVVVGTRAVKTGTEEVKVGTEQVKTGTEQYVTGTEQVKIGTERVAIGTEQVKVGIDRVKIGTEDVADGVRNVVIGTRRIADGRDDVLTGFQSPTRDAALAAALTPAAKIDISTAARKIVDIIGSTDFDIIKFSEPGLGGPDASQSAVAQLNALTDVSLSDAGSADRLNATLERVDGALRATENLKSTVSTKPSLPQSGLLPLAFARDDGKVDAAALLAQAISGYGTASPFYGSGSATAIGAGVLRINSLV